MPVRLHQSPVSLAHRSRAMSSQVQSSGPNRVERMLNLLACLLDTRRPLTRDELVRQVAGYPPEAMAYRRAFESGDGFVYLAMPVRLPAPVG